MKTGLNLWVDYRRYSTTSFTTLTSLTTQINEMNNLRTRIIAGGLEISDVFHTLNLIQALPALYKVLQQTILESISDFKTLSPSLVCTHILSKEL